MNSRIIKIFYDGKKYVILIEEILKIIRVLKGDRHIQYENSQQVMNFLKEYYLIEKEFLEYVCL